MAPQRLENIEPATGNGAPAGPVTRKPAACRLRSTVEKPNASRPETRKSRRKPLKQWNPRPEMAPSVWTHAVGQRARRRVTASGARSSFLRGEKTQTAVRPCGDGAQHYARCRLSPKPKR